MNVIKQTAYITLSFLFLSSMTVSADTITKLESGDNTTELTEADADLTEPGGGTTTGVDGICLQARPAKTSAGVEFNHIEKRNAHYLVSSDTNTKTRTQSCGNIDVNAFLGANQQYYSSYSSEMIGALVQNANTITAINQGGTADCPLSVTQGSGLNVITGIPGETYNTVLHPDLQVVPFPDLNVSQTHNDSPAKRQYDVHSLLAALIDENISWQVTPFIHIANNGALKEFGSKRACLTYLNGSSGTGGGGTRSGEPISTRHTTQFGHTTQFEGKTSTNDFEVR